MPQHDVAPDLFPKTYPSCYVQGPADVRPPSRFSLRKASFSGMFGEKKQVTPRALATGSLTSPVPSRTAVLDCSPIEAAYKQSPEAPFQVKDNRNLGLVQVCLPCLLRETQNCVMHHQWDVKHRSVCFGIS
jgi:hypothetical protein